MSFIGKILVVMQLVLSICLMAFAAAVSTYQTNWKQKSEALEKQQQEQRASNDKLVQESKVAADNHNKALKAQTDLAQQATVTSEQLRREVGTLSQTNDELKKESAQKQQLQKDLAVDSVNRHEEIKELRAQLKTAHEDRDKEYKAKEFLETTIFDLKTDISRLSSLTKDQLRELDQYRRVLIAHKLSPDISDNIKGLAPAPKGLVGKVEDVLHNRNVGDVNIQITVGENDGLLKGHYVTVFRSGSPPKYLGKALVIEVAADSAVCRMIGKTQGQIEKGDNVATQLSN
jgi:chromosome segregation ATPase